MISLIIPTYKEANNLPTLITLIEKSLANIEHELLVVDDDSPDGTGELAEELSLKYHNLKVIHRREKRGVASAIVCGIGSATGQIVGTINADGQHPPELLPVMIEKIESHDIVIASRYIKQGQGGLSFWRRIVSRGAIVMARLILPKLRHVDDPVSGYFLFKKSVIDDTPMLSRQSSVGVSTGNKLLINLLTTGHYNSVAEVPYVFKRRQSGQSKFGARDYIAYTLFLFRLMATSGELNRVMKFCIVGGSGIIINMTLLYLLTDKLGMLYVVSAIFSWIGAVTSNFFFNDLWTFKDFRKHSVRNTLRRAVRFVSIRLVGLAIYLTLLFVLTEFIGLYYLVSGFITIVVVVIWNYLASLNLVWNR